MAGKKGRKDAGKERLQGPEGRPAEAPVEGPEVRGPEEELEALRAELEAVKAEREEWRERALRAMAELENFRKQLRDQYRQEARRQIVALLKQLLQVADHLELALQYARSGEEVTLEGVAMGVEMVHRQLLDLLKGIGVEPIEAVGRPFDPYRHEAVEALPSPDVDEETVVEEVRKGYILEGQVLRPAQVKVARPVPSPDGQDGGRKEAAAEGSAPEAGEEEAR